MFLVHLRGLSCLLYVKLLFNRTSNSLSLIEGVSTFTVCFLFLGYIVKFSPKSYYNVTHASPTARQNEPWYLRYLRARGQAAGGSARLSPRRLRWLSAACAPTRQRLSWFPAHHRRCSEHSSPAPQETLCMEPSPRQ